MPLACKIGVGEILHGLVVAGLLRRGKRHGIGNTSETLLHPALVAQIDRHSHGNHDRRDGESEYHGDIATAITQHLHRAAGQPAY